ncbi:MAG: glycosyltransferase family 4 protein [Burkholderiaceae bacterium]
MMGETSTSGLFTTLFAFGLAAALCAGLIWWALKRKRFAGLLDQPNNRSLHSRAVPRIGGWLMMLAVGCTLILIGIVTSVTNRCELLLACLWPALPLSDAVVATGALLTGAIVLTWLGRLDDRGSLSVLPRLLIHLLCAALVAFAVSPTAGSILSTAVGLPALLSGQVVTIAVFFVITLGVTWLTNLYNFMDGANGLAGLMTLIGFGTYAYLAPPGSGLALLSAACAGAALGFLLFNWDPARLFMGDAGSIPLGFLAGAIGLTGARSGYWGWFVPMGIFLPFVFDASTTLAIRAWRGERLTAAHRTHTYQILVMSGLGHHRTALLYGGFMVICSLTSATSSYLSNPVKWVSWAVIIIAIAGMAVVVRRKRQH